MISLRELWRRTMISEDTIEQIARPKRAMELLGVARTTFYRMQKTDPNFPKPIKLSVRNSGYLITEIQDYIKQLSDNRNAPA